MNKTLVGFKLRRHVALDTRSNVMLPPKTVVSC